MRDGYDSRSRSEQCLERGDVETAVVVDRRHTQLRAGLLAHQLPWHDVRVVFHPRDQHLVTGFQTLPAEACRDEVDGIGGAAREYDFLCRCGIDEAPNFFARAFERGRGTLTQQVDAAMHVRVIQAMLEGHGFMHGVRRLTRRRVVEVCKWFAVHQLVQGREIASQDGEVVTQVRYALIRCGAHVGCSATMPSRAVTRSRSRARQGSSRTRSSTLAANAVVSIWRAASASIPRARR